MTKRITKTMLCLWLKYGLLSRLWFVTKYGQKRTAHTSNPSIRLTEFCGWLLFGQRWVLFFSPVCRHGKDVFIHFLGFSKGLLIGLRENLFGMVWRVDIRLSDRHLMGIKKLGWWIAGRIQGGGALPLPKSKIFSNFWALPILFIK